VKAFWLTIAGALLAAVGFEFGDGWPHYTGTATGVFGTLLTVAGAWRQHRIPVRHEHVFEATQWLRGALDEYELHVPASKHRRGPGSSVAVYRADGNGYEEVVCDVRHTKAGGVVISASAPFAGKLVVT
jgi:hypothetical protein